MPPPTTRASPSTGRVDGVIEALLQIFIVGKGYALFSLLFGLSFALQMQRGRASRSRARLPLSLRLAAGDAARDRLPAQPVLLAATSCMVYALLGLPMLLFYRVPDRWLLALAARPADRRPRGSCARRGGGPTSKAQQQALTHGAWKRPRSGTGRRSRAADLARSSRNNATDGLRNKWDLPDGLHGSRLPDLRALPDRPLGGAPAASSRTRRRIAPLFKRLLRWTGGLYGRRCRSLMIGLCSWSARHGRRSSRAAGAEGGIPDVSGWPIVVGISVLGRLEQRDDALLRGRLRAALPAAAVAGAASRASRRSAAWRSPPT